MMKKVNVDFYADKTIIVTGATGLIGSHLVERLMEAENTHVIAISRNEEKLKTVFEKYLLNSKFSIIAQDASLPFPVLDKDVDMIFHAASPISGQIIADSPVDVIEPNIFGIKNCLDFLKEQEDKKRIRGRLIVFSSATVYGNLSQEDLCVAEDDTSTAISLDSLNAPYSESKRMVEVLVKAYYRQYKVDSVIARCSYVYGYSYYQPNTAFYEFINRACKQENITINNGGLARRDNIYVEDVVSGLLCLGEHGKSAESYNLSSGAEMGNFVAADEMAEIIAEVSREKYGIDINVDYVTEKNLPRRPGIILDNSKIRELGWRLETSIKQGIEKTVSAYKEAR